MATCLKIYRKFEIFWLNLAWSIHANQENDKMSKKIRSTPRFELAILNTLKIQTRRNTALATIYRPTMLLGVFSKLNKA